MTLTKQMIRDHLIFKGPSSLTEIVSMLNLSSSYRETVLDILGDLENDKVVVLDTDNGIWTCKVTL